MFNGSLAAYYLHLTVMQWGLLLQRPSGNMGELHEIKHLVYFLPYDYKTTGFRRRDISKLRNHATARTEVSDGYFLWSLSLAS